MSRVESQLRPDPEHDRLILRINSKLDMIENSQRMKIMGNAGGDSYSSSYPSVRLGASAGGGERGGGSSSSNNARSSENGESIHEIRDRIDRLTALRARYAKEEKDLMEK